MSQQNNHRWLKDKSPEPKGDHRFYWIYLVVFFFIMLSFFFLPDQRRQQRITFNKFAKELVPRGWVKKVVVVANERLAEVYLTPEALQHEEFRHLQPPQGRMLGHYPHVSFRFVSGENLEKFLQKHDIPYEVEERTDILGTLLQFAFPILLILLLWMFFARRIGSGVGGTNFFNIGKSKAKLFEGDKKVNVTFDDVAGLEEAKQEVQEIVDFLKEPEKYTRLGGRIPRGVLLVGPPGTGKTLLAKAVAGEAQVPFFSISGSDFVEMFVGVGAARVRDLFQQAKAKAPCIIFIDEIDAIGRSRTRISITGGNDERENTLNQLLVEMDGFDSSSAVIIIAATNRPDILDPALLRPGRFDRVIAVDKPNLKEREEIFKVHLKKLVTAPDVDPARLAAQTPGFVGADIMNVCNEAALIAARKNKPAVDMEALQEAIDRVIGGLEKKNHIISPEEKKIVAYHEAGHAVAAWFLEHADPVVKVSIIPRGIAALGYAQYMPKEQYLYTYSQLMDKMCMALGGRAAEELVFNEISTGAQNDLERVTRMAYAMVTLYGMNKNVGQISFKDLFDQEQLWVQKPYSEELARKIDEEAKKIIEEAYERTKKLLTLHRDGLERLAQALLEKEILYQEDVEQILGKRPFDTPQQNIPSTASK